jgi:hypothetical protein
VDFLIAAVSDLVFEEDGDDRRHNHFDIDAILKVTIMPHRVARHPHARIRARGTEVRYPRQSKDSHDASPKSMPQYDAGFADVKLSHVPERRPFGRLHDATKIMFGTK